MKNDEKRPLPPSGCALKSNKRRPDRVAAAGSSSGPTGPVPGRGQLSISGSVGKHSQLCSVPLKAPFARRLIINGIPDRRHQKVLSTRIRIRTAAFAIKLSSLFIAIALALQTLSNAPRVRSSVQVPDSSAVSTLPQTVPEKILFATN